jgi:hypothetical protein
MKRLARRYAWWPKINDDIERLAKSCEPCRLSANDPNKSYQSWPQTQEPWERIHIDFAGPFKEYMWLICVDSHSKYPYVGLMDIGKTTSTNTIEVLKQIFATEGLPKTIITDNGPQFTSKEFDAYCTLHGIKHVTSPPFHPASNGEAERFVQSLKKGIEKNCEGGDSLKKALQSFLTTYRCLPHPMLCWKSPAEVLHGRQPRNLLSLISPSSDSHRHRSSQPTNTTTRYNIDSLVYARNYGSGPKWLQGKVIKQLGDMLFIIRTDRGLWKRHQNQLQPRIDIPIFSNIEPNPEINPNTSKPNQSQPNHNQHRDNERKYPCRERRQPDYYDSTKYA